MARISLSSVINSNFFQRVSSLGASSSASSALTGGGSPGISVKLQNGARVFTTALQNLNSSVSALNLTRSTLSELKNITEELIEITERAASAKTPNQVRRRLNTEFNRLANDFEKLVEDAELDDYDILTVTGLEELFLAVGLDREKSSSVAEVFAKFIGDDGNLADDSVSGSGVIPPGAYGGGGGTTESQTLDQVSDLAADAGAISGNYNVYLDASAQTLYIEPTAGGQNTLSGVDELLTVNSDSGYSVIRSTSDYLTGQNADNNSNLFLVDETGSVIQQLTNNQNSTSFTESQISDNAIEGGAISSGYNIFHDTSVSTLYINTDGGSTATLANVTELLTVNEETGYSVIKSSSDFMTGQNTALNEQLFLVDETGSVVQQITNNQDSTTYDATRISNAAIDAGGISSAYNIYYDSTTSTLSINTDGGGTATLANVDELVAVNDVTGYSVIKSTQDFRTGENSNNREQLFLVDATGSVVQQLTDNQDSVSQTETQISNESSAEGGAISGSYNVYFDEGTGTLTVNTNGTANDSTLSNVDQLISVNQTTGYSVIQSNHDYLSQNRGTNDQLFLVDETGTVVQQLTNNVSGTAGYTLDQVSNTASEGGVVTENYNFYRDGNDLKIEQVGGSTTTINIGNSFEILGANEGTDHVIIESTGNHSIGGSTYNPSNYRQVFLLDSSGTFVQQYTDNDGTMTDYTFAEVSGDNLGIALTGTTSTVNKLQAFTISSLGDDPSTATTLADNSTTSSAAALDVSSDFNYAVFVSSTGGAQMVDLSATPVPAVDTTFQFSTNIVTAAFNDSGDVYYVVDGGASLSVYDYTYNDGSLGSAILSGIDDVDEFAALEFSGGTSYFSFEDTTNDEVKVYSYDGLSTTLEDTLSLGTSDSIETLSMTYDSSGNADLGLYGTITSEDSDTELYRYDYSAGTSATTFDIRDADISDDNKKVIVSGTTESGTGVSLFEYTTEGDAPSSVTKTVLDTGTVSQYTNVQINDAGTYYAYVDSTANAGIFADVSTRTENTFLNAQSDISSLGFTDANQLVVARSGGNVESFLYSDSSFTNTLLTGATVNNLATMEDGSQSKGYFTFSDGSDILLYDEDGDSFSSYTLGGSDSVSDLSIAFDGSGNVDVGVLGVMPSINSDNDTELYRIETSTTAAGSLTITDADISSDNKKVVVSGDIANGGTTGANLFEVGTIGDAASAVTVTNLASGTSGRYTEITISNDGNYYAYVDTNDNSAVFADTATRTANTYLSGTANDITDLGFTGNSTLAIVRSNGNVEGFAYADSSYTNTLLSSVASIANFTTTQESAGNGYFGFQNSNDINIYDVDDTSSAVSTFTLQGGDSLSDMNLAIDASGNVEAGLVGVIPSVDSDADTELYRYEATVTTAGTITHTDSAISSDNQTILFSGNYAGTEGVTEFVIGTIGDDADQVTQTGLATGVGDASRYTSLAISNNETYYAYVDTDDNSAVFADFATDTANTYLSGTASDVSAVGFLDNDTIGVARSNGNIEAFDYTDTSFDTTLLSGLAATSYFTTAQDSTGGVFAFSDGTDILLYDADDTSSSTYSYTLQGGDSVTSLSIALDPSSNVDLGIVGTMPSINSDTDEELYRVRSSSSAGGSITTQDAAVSSDGKTFLFSGNLDGTEGVQLFEVGTIGENASAVTKTALATGVGTATRYTDLAVNDLGTYYAYVDTNDNSAVLADVSTQTANAFLQTATDVNDLGFIDTTTLAVARSTGAVESFSYSDTGFDTTLLTGQSIGAFATLDDTGSNDGYFAFEDTSTNALKVYDQTGTEQYSYSIDAGDSISNLTMGFDADGNVELGVYGSLPSINSDSDTELYRLNVTLEEASGALSRIRSSQVYERIFENDRTILTRPEAYQMLYDLEELLELLETNIETVDEATDLVNKNIELARGTGLAFLDLSERVSTPDDADKVAQLLRQAIRSNAKGALNQIENLDPITTAALIRLTSGDE